jgi:hypothetical protein
MSRSLGIYLIFLNLISFSACAQVGLYSDCKKHPIDNEQDGKPYITPKGVLELYRCGSETNGNEIGRVILAGREVFNEKNSLWITENNSEQSIFIYEGGNNRTSLIGPCTGIQYILDIRKSNIKLIAFGIKNACNQIDKIIWKKDHVIINFNRDAKFVYSYASGKMQLPKDDPDRYDPIFDENSPVIEAYKRNSYPHQKYELAPPYAKEIMINW